MQVGSISFCDKVAYNIKSDAIKSEILKVVENEFGVKIIQRHHEKFDASSINVLNKNPHLVCTRTNGNPYLFYLTKLNHVNQCIFIDKKIQQGYFYPRMIIVRSWFDDRLFDEKGTLFDGEMVKDREGKWSFIINDLIAMSGSHLGQYNLLRRLELIFQIFDSMYMKDVDIDHCRFEVKKYFHYEEINQMINEFIPQLPYSTRGLIFKSLHLKFRDILMNFDDSLVKKVFREKYKNLSEFLMNVPTVPDQTSIRNITNGIDNLNIQVSKENQNVNSKNLNDHVPLLQIIQSIPSIPTIPTIVSRSSSISNELSNDFGFGSNVGNVSKEKNIDVEKTFFARKTNSPDVYELTSFPSTASTASATSSTSDEIGAQEVFIACVPTLKTSVMMREAMVDCNVKDKVKVLCIMHPKFNKWMPIKIL